MLNLLTNAIKFTPEGGHVAVSTRLLDGGDIEVKVSDTGVGIPADEQAALFSPFERASHATVRVIEGTGLGLAISKALVEAHGGTISLESVPDRGTTVRFTLPRSITAENAQPILASVAA